jgi:MFS family permease
MPKSDHPAAQVGEARQGGLASLQHPMFRWLFISNGAFFFAMNGQFVVRSVLAYQLTGSKLALGIINLAVALPMLICSPFGGVVADRFNRTRIVMAGQAFIVLNEVCIFALLVSGHLQFWHLITAVGVMGVIFPFMMPARQSMTADIVGRDMLANAMALTMSAMNAARVIAPALAGLLISLVSIRWMYLIAVIVYGVAFVSMSRVHVERLTVREKKPVLSDLADGFRYVKNEPTVRALMIFSIVPMLLGMPFQALLVVFSEDIWHMGSGGLGILNAAAGLGGVVGSFLVAFTGEQRKPLRIMLAAVLGFSGALFLFALSPWFLLALPLVFIADAFVNVFQTLNGTTTQMIVPDHIRGRVMSLMMMSFGLTPLGSLPVAAAAEAWGAPAAVAGAAVITAVLSVVCVLVSRSLRTLDLAAVRARTTQENARHASAVAVPSGSPAGGR